MVWGLLLAKHAKANERKKSKQKWERGGLQVERREVEKGAWRRCAGKRITHLDPVPLLLQDLRSHIAANGSNETRWKCEGQRGTTRFQAQRLKVGVNERKEEAYGSWDRGRGRLREEKVHTE